MKLIDKDAVLAIIEKELSYYKDLEDRGILSEAGIAAYRVIRLLKSDIDSLEVKEMDLEHEVESYWKQCDMTWCRDAYSMTHIRSMLSDIVKHFFELGLQAQKGE